MFCLKIRRALKYLEFVKKPNSYENDDSKLVYKILGVNDPYITKSPNLILKQKWSPKQSRSYVIPEELSENETIKLLTEQEDQRDMDEKSRKRLKRQMKKISGNFKPKTDTLHSSWSDLSFPNSTRSSLTEIGNILKFRKQRNHQSINRSISDGSGMASLLVSSIIHGPSLDSISETEASVKTSSMSDLQLTDKPVEDKKNVETRELKNKFEILNTCSKSSTNISMCSVTSTETTIESEDDDEYDEDEPSVIFESETISMVVRSVLAEEGIENKEEIPLNKDIDCIEDIKRENSSSKNIIEKNQLDTISEDETTKDLYREIDHHRKNSVLHDLKDKIHYLQVLKFISLNRNEYIRNDKTIILYIIF